MVPDVAGFESFVGVDLHKCTVTLKAVSRAGEPVCSLKISTKCVDKIESWLRALPQPVWLAVEACPFETVPGIGAIWSLIIAAEIGPFDRFPNSDTLEFWAGLTLIFACEVSLPRRSISKILSLKPRPTVSSQRSMT